MDVIGHKTAECVGNWRLTGSGSMRVISCEECHAEYAATPENRLAAIDENYAGIYLRRLTAEGSAAMERER